MATLDLQTFIQERITAWDENVDVSPGSPVDSQVIQPILRRLGSDPFTMDLLTFAQDRLSQEFPDLAIKEGDSITDLLLKPAVMLWDPFVREVFRIRNGLSFKDPTTLTTAEADALGANLFSTRNTGNFSYGVGRVYFSAPQGASFTPANFFTSSQGLHFFPKGVQSIRAEEMMLNKEGDLYYFDVNTVAESAGDEYNIPVDDLVSVANVASAVRVTNKRRFRFGVPEEDAPTFVGRSEQSLTERSLTTQRGIVATITENFSEVTRLADVGFNDPEMQRDVLRGGGLGPILAAGSAPFTAPDLENKPYSRRFTTTDTVDFTALIGPVKSAPEGYVLTLYNCFGGVAPTIRDLHVRAVVDANTLDLEEQVLAFNTPPANRVWMLRRQELTLSGIPGGIIFPDGPNGTVAVQDDVVHIGGATDVLVRGAAFDSASLLLDAVTDDIPLLQGVMLYSVQVGLVFYLTIDAPDLDLTDPEVTQILQDAVAGGYTMQVMDGPVAGNYRITGITGNIFRTIPSVTLATPVGERYRWKISDVLDINLAEPKETRVSGSDMRSIQNSDIVSTTGATNFKDFGVSVNDVLRILDGPDAGDFTVKVPPLAPFFIQLQVDRPFIESTSGIKYTIFRPNTAGGVNMPLVRVSSIDLLDSNGQPVGSKVPYALPVDVRSQAFANTGNGVRVDVTDGELGIVSRPLSFPVAFDSWAGLTIVADVGSPVNVHLTGTGTTMSSLLQAINNAAVAYGRIAYEVEGNRVGIASIGVGTQVYDLSGSGNAMSILFASDSPRRCSEVHSVSSEFYTGLSNLSVGLDALNVLDGNQIGFYEVASDTPSYTNGVSTAHEFAPEVARHIQLGSRSIGTARVFFLEPTSIDFAIGSYVSTVLDGRTLRFLPDPTAHAQKIPAKPDGAQPLTGQTTIYGTTFTDGSQDFIRKGIVVGDELTITYKPITGTVPITDPVNNLHGKYLILSLAGGPNQHITFINDSSSILPTQVTRAGVVDQINNAVGQTICKLTTSGPNTVLEFEPTVLLEIRKEGTANATLLFPSWPTDRNNRAGTAATYPITFVTPTVLTLNLPSGMGATEARLQYQIHRPGDQRISTTEMSVNKGAAGLYYMDLVLVSEGTGNAWNIPADQAMTPYGYTSDGYWLTTEDANLTFSPAERPWIHISRTILEVGVTDDPTNATQISGQNLLVNYDRSGLVSSVNNFITSDTERVICESMLARHLIPHFVRFDLTYVGGDKESVVQPDVEKYINDLNPDDYLEVSQVEDIVNGHGAVSITNPLELVAVINNFDRTVTVDRSQDKLNTGRLAAFIPDQITLKRNTT